jgi:hypothetical protein
MATARQKAAARENIKAAQRHSHEKAHPEGGELTQRRRNDLPKETFAFPKERKEPLTDARHVRNAVARFDQVEGVSDHERDLAWRRIRTAARKYGVEIHERGWRALMKGGASGGH